jgi:hypothetical protein
MAIAGCLKLPVYRKTRLAGAVLLCAFCLAEGQIRLPFCIGDGMGNLGAIHGGAAGNDPWVPACESGDSAHYGVYAAGVDFFDRMDNLPGQTILAGAVGGFYAWRFISAKAAFRQFNALNVLYEQAGHASIGLRWGPVRPSIELDGFRAGLAADSRETETAVELGCSVWVPFRHVALSAIGRNFSIEKADAQGFMLPPEFSLGIHSRFPGMGAQGVIGTTIFDNDVRFRLTIGEEFWILKQCGITLGVESNPFIFGCGILVALGGGRGAFSMVNHPDLGWSRGISLEWAK